MHTRCILISIAASHTKTACRFFLRGSCWLRSRQLLCAAHRTSPPEPCRQHGARRGPRLLGLSRPCWRANCTCRPHGASTTLGAHSAARGSCHQQELRRNGEQLAVRQSSLSALYFCILRILHEMIEIPSQSARHPNLI